MQVGRWVSINAALALLRRAADRAGTEILDAAVSAGLVAVNPGPVPHSVKLTEAGLVACRRAL